MKSFGSDNHSKIDASILNAIIEANVDHDLSYGDDLLTKEAEKQFKMLFGDVSVFFVLNGTGANVTGLQSMLKSFNSVICASTAHINVDECGAPEKLSQAKLVPIETSNGKLTEELIRPYLTGFGFCHHSQPKVISISQVTEMGTVYSLAEIKKLADLAHSFNMYLHVDGARFANAMAALECSPKEFAATGVDVLSFGGTKNGMMIGEAVLFFREDLAQDFLYIRKQSMQLYSKMRFVSAQFIAYLKDDNWIKLARQSNEAAKFLYQELLKIPAVKITQEPAANAIFLIFPDDKRELIRSKYFFYDWNESIGEVRLMTSFDTTKEDIEGFISFVKSIL